MLIDFWMKPFCNNFSFTTQLTLGPSWVQRISTPNKMFLTPTEVAEALGIGRSTAYGLISSGAIPSVRIGSSVRVPTTALLGWIADQRVNQKSARGTDDGPA